jgi:hypothetical protein
MSGFDVTQFVTHYGHKFFVVKQVYQARLNDHEGPLDAKCISVDHWAGSQE